MFTQRRVGLLQRRLIMNLRESQSHHQPFRDNISVKLWKKLGHLLNRILQVEGREEFVRLSVPDGQR